MKTTIAIPDVKPRMFEMDSDEYCSLVEDNMGLCLHCSAEIDGVEPDGRNYFCEVCEEYEVFGVEELMMMGRIIIL